MAGDGGPVERRLDERSERRIARLEKLVAQQGYIVHILMVVVIFDTAAILVLWGEKGTPDYDHIAVALTVFQTLFGIAALYGFWALRGLTKEKAEEVTEAEVAKIAPPLIRRLVSEALQAYGNESRISDDDLSEIVDAIGDEEGRDGE